MTTKLLYKLRQLKITTTKAAFHQQSSKLRSDWTARQLDDVMAMTHITMTSANRSAVQVNRRSELCWWNPTLVLHCLDIIADRQCSGGSSSTEGGQILTAHWDLPVLCSGDRNTGADVRIRSNIHFRARKKDCASHIWSTRDFILISANLRCSTALQLGVHCRHVQGHSIRASWPRLDID